MIRVALVSHSPNFSGAERMLYNLALILKRSKLYYPIVLLPMCLESQPFLESCRESEIEFVEIDPLDKYIFISDSNRSEVSSHTLAGISVLRLEYQKHNIDLVICNTATSIVPILAAIELSIPIISWIHGILDSYMLTHQYDTERRLLFDRLLMAMSSQVLCCSDWTTAYFKPFCLVPIETMHNWTPNVVEVQPLTKETDTFVCLNTFDESKGIKTLLQGVKILAERDKIFELHLYGSGSVEATQTIESFIEKFKLKKKVKLKGRTNNIESVYNNSLCLIQPSYIESFGMTLIEAMAYQRPVIAARSGGPQEIVQDGISGFLVDRNDPEELAEKMAHILEHKEEAIQMGLRGEEIYIEHFSTSRASTDFLNVIDRVYNSYKGVTQEQWLYHDAVINLLRSESKSSGYHAPSTSDCKISRLVESNRLCFSGDILKKRSYKIHCNKQLISELGVIFSCHQENIYHGKVTMNLYTGTKLLRTTTLNLNTIITERWIYFTFTPLQIESQVLIVELDFQYDVGSAKLGVYEDHEQRSFVYKVFNKLGYPLKGMDALFTDVRG